jgi:mono/diheme cytochrome c family protein
MLEVKQVLRRQFRSWKWAVLLASPLATTVAVGEMETVGHGARASALNHEIAAPHPDPLPGGEGGISGDSLEESWQPSQILPASAELLELGRATYQKQCSACHGTEGRGDGEAACLLYPKPRDLTSGRYRLVSSWERVPTDLDLFTTISRGMPGSAMPSWGYLPERTRWGLVHYVKSLAKTPWTIASSHAPDAEGSGATGLIEVPPEPPYDPAAQQRVQELYAEACASCHGATGRGDGAESQVDEEGYATRPRDLTGGVFKGNPEPAALYRRIVAGMPGTPMPMSDWAYGEDAWHLVHYIRSLSSAEQRGRVEMRRFTITATRVEAIPDHPDAGIWLQTPPANLHLMPLWWRAQRPEELAVRALHDGKNLALLLVWDDATDDHTAMRPQDFRDGAAVEFALGPDPPFFAMGQRATFVNIWMWKSERQADLEPAFQDLEKVYPNIGIDSYPNLLRAPYEQPTRNALTLESDPTFVTAWGAGNIVSDPTRQSAAEDLKAQGFGTLKARPRPEQGVSAKGIYGTGSYRVVLWRSLAAQGEQSVELTPGQTVPVAFAVWNGSAGDRDGKKSVTIWQDLRLAP